MSAARISLAELRATILRGPHVLDPRATLALCDAVEAAQAVARAHNFPRKPGCAACDQLAEALAPFAAAPVDRAPGEEVR